MVSNSTNATFGRQTRFGFLAFHFQHAVLGAPFRQRFLFSPQGRKLESVHK
jgi:hypothetical protein